MIERHVVVGGLEIRRYEDDDRSGWMEWRVVGTGSGRFTDEELFAALKKIGPQNDPLPTPTAEDIALETDLKSDIPPAESTVTTEVKTSETHPTVESEQKDDLESNTGKDSEGTE